MGRAPCCEKVGLKKGKWTAEEDEILRKYIETNGEGSWRSLPRNAGLLRCGKSCRLRWINYLKSDVKRGQISEAEEEIIVNLHASMGNRWSLIAGYLPGRTDNEIKNYWTSHLSRKLYIFRRRNALFIPPPVAEKPKRSKKKSKQNDRKSKPKEKSNNNSGVEIMPTTPTPEKESLPTTGDIIPERMRMRTGIEMENEDLGLDDIMEEFWGILDSEELEESGLGIELEKNGERILDSGELEGSETGIQLEKNGEWILDFGELEELGAGMTLEKHGEEILDSGELEKSGAGMELEKNGEWILDSGKLEESLTGMELEKNGGWILNFGVLESGAGIELEKNGEWILDSGELEELGTGMELQENGEWILDYGKLEESGSGIELEKNGEWILDSEELEESGAGMELKKNGEWVLDSGKLEESGPRMELGKNGEWNLDSREWDWGQEEDTFSWLLDAGEESGKTGSFDNGSISFGWDNELVSWLMS